MKILLGIFNTAFFKKFKENTDALSFGQFATIIDIDIYGDGDYRDNVVKLVTVACIKAEKIHFILDDINVPLSTDSITCRELLIILNSSTLLKKTVFYKDGAEIDTKTVKKQYLKPTKLPRYVKTNLSLQLQESTE